MNAFVDMGEHGDLLHGRHCTKQRQDPEGVRLTAEGGHTGGCSTVMHRLVCVAVKDIVVGIGQT